MMRYQQRKIKMYRAVLACRASARMLRRMCEYIDRNLDQSICLEDMARVLGISTSHFLEVSPQNGETDPA
jgi:AraC-like DNA-binding protein